ncbi:hypothetical protein BDN72DRAFT_903720 [Pluteus cervinus]|uniref:Uncharacterized protein n=1 Tax=Pluteus cervinus TaxID=181527 RepID=A0ACD3A7M4_9AGAR|nr:hypothetical protein BDN72DRAFT_903720 [Pluteus cervinus]
MPQRGSSSSQKPSRKRSKSSKSDALLQVSSLVVSTLKDAASYAPIPGLQQAAGIALTILDAAQAVKTNKQAYAQLAEDVCEILYIVIRTIQDAGQKGDAPSGKLTADLEKVKQKLVPIDAFIKKQLSRNILMRLLCYKADSGKIQDHRNALKHSLELFGLESHIVLREATSSMMSQQEELLSQLRSQQPTAPIDPRQLYGSMAGFPSITASGTITVTNVAGNYNVSSVNNTTVNEDSENVYYGDDNIGRDTSRRGTGRPRGRPLRRVDSFVTTSDDEDDRGISLWKSKIPKNARRNHLGKGS